uniref:T cell receptor beta variable 30 n=1 Tax=Chrysemys picta bellii TaxID=8478 RepID=A0A8C3P4U9_CHRPI
PLYSMILSLKGEHSVSCFIVAIRDLGRQISLECSLEGTSNPYIYWYRQLPGGQIYMLAYSVSIGQVDNTGPSHFSTSRTKDKEFLLSINGLLANDTGVYYCAWSHTLRQVCAAPGQKLPLLPTHGPMCPSLVVQQAAAACKERE